jgi:phosphatidylinositol alpha-mannosyltransferase
MIAGGHRPHLITAHRGRRSETVEDGLPVLRLPRPPQPEVLGYEPYLTHIPLSYSALRRGEYDLAHAVYPTDALAAARWRRTARRPAVLSYMGIPDRVGLCMYRKRRDITLAALRGSDAVVALSRAASEAFRYWLGYEARVIPPGVDLEAFARSAPRAETPVVVCPADAGEPRKQVGLLIEAHRLLKRELPDARLVLSRPRSFKAAARAGVSVDAPGVEWRALDDRDQLARAYSEAWVAALPSVGEAFGLVLVEALACGTPVVGYDGGAIAEIVDRPQIGRLFDRSDAQALSAALLEAIALTSVPGTAEACRARAEDYSVQRCTDSYLSLYRELT